MADLPDSVVDVWAECRLLRERVEELEAAHERLLRRLASTAEEAGRSAERARLYAADAATLRKQLVQSEAYAEALVNSSSWRLTRPVRTVVDPLRRMAGRRRGPGLRAAAPLLAEPVRRPSGPPPDFPLPADIAAHPALLAEPLLPLPERVSVIIPTWNAGPELHWLVRKLQAQRGLGGVEIITVDSGSTDGTPERAAALGCRVVPIDPAAFSHSYARNLGASLATGDLLLFMVQDAYPIGDEWLAGLAACLVRPATEEFRVDALSCAEYPRADSELMYDFMARGHYEFLGCANHDRIGRLTTLDHEGLRQQGQLSDVACLIPRALFERFQFQGRYAEDLTLGVRMIEAGFQLAMMSSIRVVHSHNRSASYYVRRSFVDLVFLAGTFTDFMLPPGHEPVGATVATSHLAALVPPFAAESGAVPARLLERVIDRWRDAALPRSAPAPLEADFGFAPLGEWIARLLRARAAAGRALSPSEQRGAEAMREMVVARLVALHHFIAVTWSVADEAAMAELRAAVVKTLAMSLGAQLASCHLTDAARGGVDPLLVELKPLLLAGI